jgi:hypothetical protein
MRVLIVEDEARLARLGGRARGHGGTVALVNQNGDGARVDLVLLTAP